MSFRELKGRVRMEIEEELIAWGHPNIKALHRSTLEITKDPYVTPRGDCIIAVRATKAVRDLSEDFKSMARREKAKITLIIEVGNFKEVIKGYGHPDLEFLDERSIVIRKSDYICPRTLMIRANKVAVDLDRRLISLLRNPNTIAKIRIIVSV